MFSRSVLSPIVLSIVVAFGALGAEDLATMRKRATALFAESNWQEALTVYRDLVRRPEAGGAKTVEDLDRATECLQRLNNEQEHDALWEEAAIAWAGDGIVLQGVARRYVEANHYGFLIAGVFQRGHHRGGGRWCGAGERDRVRALQLMRQALDLTPAAAPADQRAALYFDFARYLLFNADYHRAWRLQTLTDLTSLPDYDDGRYGYSQRGCPVDDAGKPVFHAVPANWQAATSDGQRWRWLLAEAATLDPGRSRQAELLLADFAHNQFGVQTMATYGYRMDLNPEAGKEGPWSVTILADDETLAKTAGGVQRFKLPADYDYLALYRRYGQWSSLAEIYENRGQYVKAADAWAQDRSAQARRRRAQIIDPWGRFEPILTQPAEVGATVGFMFRNGKGVTFTAYRLKTAKLLEDVKTRIRANPKQLDWNDRQVEELGYLVVQENRAQYLDDRVAQWQLDLEPLPGHGTRHLTVQTPLKQAGAYLLEAQVAGGNTSRIVIWLSDTVLVSKRLAQANWYYVADARTGAPVSGARLDFFGYDQEHMRGRQFRFTVKEFTDVTDATGQCVTAADRQLQDHQWLVTANGPGDRFAFLGWTGVWYGDLDRGSYDAAKGFYMTDRPVYRPGQPVHVKAWLRRARYDQRDVSDFAGQTVTLRITNPQGDAVYEKSLVTDAYGGLEGTFDLPADATLGVYAISIDRFGNGSFRVEEYKKPEYEVTVTAPERPVALGDTFEATITAKYYFGAPVTEAQVHYTVHRTTRDAVWYPPMPWDWLYGPGYWWFAVDWDWYPGWGRWGCPCPSPWWWWHNPSPPEVVMENEVPIGPDGTVALKINSALAQALFGDDDHEYRITAEVVDASRRTIVGAGSVIVAKDPYRVTVWVDRGHYRQGDTVRASFVARTVDGAPVVGTATCVLTRITYDAARLPVEAEVGRWTPPVDADGLGLVQLTAAAPGQYRLSCTVADTAGHTQEGAYVFNVAGGAGEAGYRFNDLELLVDRADYAPGDRVQLLVNADQPGTTVMLFVRPENGVYPPPQVVHLAGRSATVELPITLADMPNCFVEGVTISRAKVHTVTREIIVPPASRVLTVAVAPDKTRYRPGEPAGVVLTVTDDQGAPFVGTAVATIYDKSVEYISGGSNVPEIRKHFWDWRRRHQESTQHSLQRWCQQVLKQGEDGMSDLGIFGRLLADTDDAQGGEAKAGAFGLRRGGSDPNKMMMETEGMTCDASAMPCPPAACPDPVGGGSVGAGAMAVVQPTVRSQFADTALWRGNIVTDAQGQAHLDLVMPENLTTWKIRVWSLGQGTRVGQGEAEVITSKDLIVRMQAPRFFVERDEVVLSANVHNYLPAEKTVTVELVIDDVLTLTDGTAAKAEVTVPAQGEARVDWRVVVAHEGTTNVTMKALTDEESDAMLMTFPAKVHGAPKTESWSVALRPETPQQVIGFTVPKERRAGETALIARYSPTLAGALVDALPYLVSYPYGCTEQTLNRFLPTVIVQKILVDTGVDLAAVKEQRANLNAQELGDPARRAAQWQKQHDSSWPANPVFDTAEVADMVADGLRALASQQLGDGGWGWFSGYGEQSWPHTTAVVVHGLQVARGNGVHLPEGMLERGVAWLKQYQAGQVRLLVEGRKPKEERGKHWKEHADNLDALVAMVLADADVRDEKMVGFLYEDRSHLAVYGLATYGMALHRLQVADKRDMIIRNIEQFLVQDDENQTAHLNLGNGGYWWCWYGSEFEAHAFYLKLLAATEPKGEKASRLVKYLLNNRKHASCWNSTRDTAYCIEALADFLRASGEDAPDLQISVLLDGTVAKTVKVTKDNLFTFDGTCTVGPDQLGEGKHELTFAKAGTGPLYANAYLSYFSLEDHITAAGLEVKINRNYYKLVRDDAKMIQEGGRGQVVEGMRLRYQREPIENLDEVISGDLVEIELVIESKNDYEYLCIEDPKAAGTEPVDLRSGYVGDELGAYREFRDDRVTFCVQRLARGTHSLSYRVHAEIPGTFSALPTRIYGMYAPELVGNADEIKVKIRDKE